MTAIGRRSERPATSPGRGNGGVVPIAVFLHYPLKDELYTVSAAGAELSTMGLPPL